MTHYETMFSWLKKPWVIATYLALVVLAYFYVDRELAVYFYGFNLRVNLYPLKLFTNLGMWIIYVAIFLSAGIYFRYIGKHAALETKSWYLLGCIIVPNLLTVVLKTVLGRARPELLFANGDFGFYWFATGDLYRSFPSGHAVTIAGLITGLSVIFPRFFYLFLSIGLLVAASRVLLYYHYLSDVMVGFYLGLLVAGWFSHFYKKKYN